MYIGIITSMSIKYNVCGIKIIKNDILIVDYIIVKMYYIIENGIYIIV